MAADRKPNPAQPIELYADVGNAVNWYPGGDPSLRPLIGIVIEKSPGGEAGMQNLNIVTFTGAGFSVQEGVLHMSNPKCRVEGRQGGGWQHVPSQLVLNQFLLAAGAIKWDGDETYVRNPAFDPNALGRALKKLSGLTEARDPANG